MSARDPYIKMSLDSHVLRSGEVRAKGRDLGDISIQVALRYLLSSAFHSKLGFVKR